MSYYVLGDNEPIALSLTLNGQPVSLAGATAVIAGSRQGVSWQQSATISGSVVSCAPPSELTVGTWRLQVIVTFGSGAIRTYPNAVADPWVNLDVVARVTA